jgi:hypothetical protein
MPREDAFAEDGLTHSPNGPFSPESLPYPLLVEPIKDLWKCEFMASCGSLTAFRSKDRAQ